MTDTGNHLTQVEDGDFAGWVTSSSMTGFVNHAGPYHFRTLEDGRILMGFKANESHLNGGGSVHGGCLLTLADTAMFMIARPHIKDSHVVTLQLESQFISRALAGDIIIASGEVIKAAASVIFVKGQLTCEDRIILHYNGILKRIKPR